MGGTNELRLLIVETDAIAYRAIERTLAVTVDPSGPLVNRRASATSINGALAQLAFEPECVNAFETHGVMNKLVSRADVVVG